MGLPKIHPIRKTYIDLRRCSVRMNEFLARFDEQDTNEQDLYMEIQEKINALIDQIPETYKD